MRDNLRKVSGIILLLMLVLAAISVLFQRHRAGGVRQEAADTRRALRDQGFKTDLTDFNFHVTDPAICAREAAVTGFGGMARGMAPAEELDLLPTVPDGSGIVLWKQDWLQGRREEQSDWSELRDALAEAGPELDAACEAALSGPIQFDLEASQGGAMRLPHLAALRRLELTLGSRMVAELHDAHPDAAWTNAMALTRLTTAWQVEPAGVSQMVRFTLVNADFSALWQALHGAAWSDDRLAAMQREWERADFLTNLPETAAFQRATTVADCQRERQDPPRGGMPFSELIKEAARHPAMAIPAIKESWNAVRYRNYGTYVDEKNLLLFYQQRELELRHAISAPTWDQMCALPGVTNPPLFTSPYRSRFQMMLSLHSVSSRMMGQGRGLLARAATAEAQRRIIVTAIALERYRQRHGACPRTLAELTPDFLQNPPIDFMDGKPLRYQLDQAGNFLLYSVGLDGVDDGGKAASARSPRAVPLGPFGLAAAEPSDIVWPFPASAEAVQSLHDQEERAAAIQQRNEEEQQAEQDWMQSPGRSARADKILATAWNPDAGAMTFYGQSLNEYLRNEATAGTNHPALADMMAPRPVITGGEPEDITFDVPMHYEALTNAGELSVMVDADPDAEEPVPDDAGGKQQELLRATNGNCRVVWHTIFDPPGRHAVQFLLVARTERGGVFASRGPALAVTTSNLCQFSLDSATYDVAFGARFHARLPEPQGRYSIECVATNGVRLATLSGSATNGEFDATWNLMDEHGHKLKGETFNSIVHITLPDSGRSQTFRGP